MTLVRVIVYYCYICVHKDYLRQTLKLITRYGLHWSALASVCFRTHTLRYRMTRHTKDAVEFWFCTPFVWDYPDSSQSRSEGMSYSQLVICRGIFNGERRQRKIAVVAEEAWWSAREVYPPEWQGRATSSHHRPDNRFPNVRKISTTIRKLRSSCSRGGSHLITSLHPSLSLALIIINGCVSGPTGLGTPTGFAGGWRSGDTPLHLPEECALEGHGDDEVWRFIWNALYNEFSSRQSGQVINNGRYVVWTTSDEFTLLTLFPIEILFLFLFK